MPALRSALLRAAPRADKRGFAKAARGFAKRAGGRARPPGFPILWIASAAAAGLMTVTGGFGTGAMPLGQRALFWMLLMGWSALKWQLWFWRLVREPRDWLRASAIGAILLSLPLPLEVSLCASAAGLGGEMPDVFGIWGRAMAIGALVLVTILVVTRAVVAQAHQPVAPQDSGLLQRARIDPAAVIAIEAEDHYCRIHHRGGASALIHYRFGDAIEEVGGIEGAQVHRGAWVAAGAVEGAARDGRRWQLLLAGGQRIPVSATYLPQARARGWLSLG